MSAFNIVRAECRCPVCGEFGFFDVQFKYGDTWQYTYCIGNTLKWGGNDVGIRDAKKVRVEAIGGPCPNCGADALEGDVFVVDNKIKDVIIIGINREKTKESGFEILE